MKRLSFTVGLGLLVASLAACSGMSNETKGTLIGGGVGGAAGALITSSPAGAAIGAVAGGAVGNIVGRDQDKKKNQ